MIFAWRVAAPDQGDGNANQGPGHLQPGFRPEPKIVYIWGLSGPDRPPNPSKKVGGLAPHMWGAKNVLHVMLPDRKSAFRAGFRPDCYRESTESGPPAGRRPAGGPISVFSR